MNVWFNWMLVTLFKKHCWTIASIVKGMWVLLPNSISTTLVLDHKHWLLLGTYLTPSAAPDAELDLLEVEYWHHPLLPILLMGNLNANIDDTKNQHSIAIMTTLQQLGVHNTTSCFPQKNS